MMKGFTGRIRKVARLVLTAAVLCMVVGLHSATVVASTAYLVGWGQGTTVNHPNLPDGQVWAGTLTVKLGDDPTTYEVYCIELEKDWCQNAYYGQGPDIEELHIVWILNNYYPHVPDRPSGLSDRYRAAAVQLAIWHFSDGLDISSGGSPSGVFDAARAIIAAAQTASVPKAPTNLTLTPSSGTAYLDEQHTVTATVKDQNGDPLPDQTVLFTVTGANTAAGSDITDAAGRATFTYTGHQTGEDTITASVSYNVPVGLRWIKEGCQQLIMAEEGPGELTATATVEWGEVPPVGGVTKPMSKPAILTPWLMLILVVGLTVIGVSAVARKRRSGLL